MNIPSIIILVVITIVFVSIIARGIYNRKHGRGGCSCGCGDCPSKGLCHPDTQKTN